MSVHVIILFQKLHLVNVFVDESPRSDGFLLILLHFQFVRFSALSTRFQRGVGHESVRAVASPSARPAEVAYPGFRRAFVSRPLFIFSFNI